MKKRFWLAGTLLPSLLVSPAYGESLRDALIAAYQTNPTLTGARAGQRAEDENVPIARSNALPDVTAQANYQENLRVSANAFTAPDRQLFGTLTLTVPIYQGGAVKNRLKAAKERVDAGQADLRGAESSVFSNVVAAYMNVIRDEAVVGLNEANLRALQTTLRATEDRFEIGDLTLTDVAQARARLALAQSDLQTVQANLINAKETYIQIVGNAPGQLEPPPPLPNFPKDPDMAVVDALDNNPDLIAARQRVDASDLDIKAARAARRPQIEAYSQANYSNFFGTLGGTFAAGLVQSEITTAAGLRGSLPIFQGGRPSAQVRQAQARSGQAIEAEIATERSIVAQARAAYASWRASLQVTESSQLAVEANALALEGVRAENSVGNRTVLDILDAERELLSAQVQLVTARRNAYVAGFTLLAAMGRAEARDLGLDGGVLYDPQDNYDRVRRKIFDFDDDAAPVAQATRTVDTQAQNATLIGPVLPENQK